jgi:selenide,water dikinase
MDCSIVPLLGRPGNLFHVSTTDFFYPAIEDPIAQGRIGCANVLSDMYSMGIDHIDTMLMLLAASSDMPEGVRYLVAELMMKGFMETAKEAGVHVTGGQTVLNPWPIIGGVAMSVVRNSDMVRPDGLAVGDVLVLTKPLGTQVAVNAFQALRKDPEYLKGVVTSDEIRTMYHMAVLSMSHLNRAGAGLMRTHDAHGGTDVTGFGILGHATNLAKAQPLKRLVIRIHLLPCIAGTCKVDTHLEGAFGLLQGYSAETSGGLLVAFPSRTAADAFLRDLRAQDGTCGWVVGDVAEGGPSASEDNAAVIVPSVTNVEVGPMDWHPNNRNTTASTIGSGWTPPPPPRPRANAIPPTTPSARKRPGG